MSSMTPKYIQGAGRGGMSKVPAPARGPASVKSDSSGTTHTSDLSATRTTVAATNTKKQKSNGLSDSEAKQLLELTMKYRQNSLTNAETRKMLHLTQKEDGTVTGGAKKARRKRWPFPKDATLKQQLASAYAEYFQHLEEKLQDCDTHEDFLREKIDTDQSLAESKADAFEQSALKQFGYSTENDAAKEMTDYKRAWGVVKRLQKKVFDNVMIVDEKHHWTARVQYIASVLTKYNSKDKFLDALHFSGLKPILLTFYKAMSEAWTKEQNDPDQAKKDKIAAVKAKRTAMTKWRKDNSVKARPRQMRQGLSFETGMPSLYEQDSYDDDY